MLSKHDLSLDKAPFVPLILCGDFNSKPDSCVFHLMNAKSYDIYLDGRTDPKQGIRAYRNERHDMGKDKMKQVQVYVTDNIKDIEKVHGKISSSYMLLNANQM